MMPWHRKPPREQGVALITAVLIVALAAAVVTAMIGRQQLDIRRTANMLEADQIALYARGLASWAGEILSRDHRAGRVDHLNEAWATVLPPISVENGQLSGRLEDMQGRFNLNSLVVGGVPDPLAVARFRRLLRLLGLDEDLAVAVLDWLDADINPGFPAGAEDDLYLGLEPAYRAGNSRMVSPSELRLINAIDGTAYDKLQPHISTLPVPTPINVNTATAPVLMSLAENISEENAQQLINGRGKEGYASVAQFLANKELAGREIVGDGLSVGSNYFMAIGDVQFGRIQQRYFTLLDRLDNGRVKILTQSTGTL